MERKKFVKFGLTQIAFELYVPLTEKELPDYILQNIHLDYNELLPCSRRELQLKICLT